MFTSNRVQAAPVLWSRQAVADGRARAVVLNSGGANCFTGSFGFQTTHQTAEKAAELLGGSIGAEAGFEGVSVGSSVPARRIAPMFDLIAEIAYEPSLPEREVERLRALRLAQIEQAAASPRAICVANATV